MGDLVWSQEENFPIIRMADRRSCYLFHVFPIPLLRRVGSAEAWLF